MQFRSECDNAALKAPTLEKFVNLWKETATSPFDVSPARFCAIFRAFVCCEQFVRFFVLCKSYGDCVVWIFFAKMIFVRTNNAV